MDNTAPRYTAPNAGFVRGIAAEHVRGQAEDQLLHAEIALLNHPECPVVAAVARGAREWLRQVYVAHRIPIPDDLNVNTTEVLSA